MIEIKAPNEYPSSRDCRPKIFLAGSIEMGTAENWQDRVARELSNYDVILLNPRRDDWDSSLTQSINEPQFNEQVNWELDGIDAADIIIFYFDPNTKSPITLMELGLVAGTPHVLVCCPDGFWRKGNVEIVCKRHDIKLVNTLPELIHELQWRLNGMLGT